MGTPLATAFVRIRPDTSGFRQEAEKGILGDLDKVGAVGGTRLGEALRKALANTLNGTDLGKKVGDDFAKGFIDQAQTKTKDAPVGPEQSRTRKQGQDSGGSFADAFRQKLEQASKAFPPLNISVAKDAAEQQIRDLQTKLRDLSGQTIGVDLDAGAAIAQVRELETQLRDLAASTPNIQVRADAAAALARLEQVTVEVDKLDRKNVEVNVDVDTDRASRTVSTFASGLASRLGEAFSGVSSIAETFFQSLSEGAVKAGGQITASVVSAAAGEAVMTTATAGLNLVLGALALGLLAAAGTVAVLTVGMVALAPIVLATGGLLGGFATLLTGTAAGAGVLFLGLHGLGSAFTAMGAAQDDAAKSSASFASAQNAVRNASDGVRSALAAEANTRANVADAARRAALQVTDAVQRVKDAQQTLTDAERDALQVRKDLTRAQTEAKQNLEDLASQVKSNALDQRQAVLDVADAQKALQKVLKDPKATAEQRAQAQLTYERQVQQLDDLRVRGQRLAAEQADANKKGVNGSDQVVAARQRIAAADRKVIDSQRGVAQAQASAAEARRAQQTQERQGAYQLAQASQAVVAAQRALAQASTQAGVAGGSALQKLNQEMAKLSPNARTLVKTLFGLKGPFDELRKFVQDRLLEGVSGQVKDLAQKWLPPLHGILGGLADRLNGFADGLFKAFGNNTFIKNIRDAVAGFGDMIARIGRAMPGFIDAFGRIASASVPVLRYIGDLIGGIVTKFSDWIRAADKTGSLKSFMKDAAASLHQIFDIGGLVFRLIGELVQILFPQSKQASAGFLGGVEDTLKKIVGWLADPQNQQKVRAWVAAVSEFVKKVTTEWIPQAIIWINVISGWVGTVAGWINSVRRFVSALVAAFSNAYTQVSGIINGLRGFIAGQVATIIRFLQSLRDFVSISVVAGFRAFSTIVGAILGTFAAGVRSVWDSIRTGSLDPLRRFITGTLPNAFQMGVNAIKKAWSTVQEAARVPVAFVATHVINPLAKGWNAVASVVAPSLKLPDPAIPGFEAGGRIPGPASSTDNRIAALYDQAGKFLSPLKVATGEFIVNARDTAKALPLLRWINSGMRGDPQPGVIPEGTPYRHGGHIPGYDSGGLVGWVTSLAGKSAKAVSNVFKVISDPSAAIKKLAQDAIKAIPGSGFLRQALVSGAGRLLDGIIGKIKSLFVPSTGGVGGAASGITANSSPGFPPWPSSPSASRGDSGVWRNIVALIKSTGPLSGSFGNSYRPGDPLWHGSGRAVDWMGENQDALATFLAHRRPLELIHRTRLRDYAYTRGVNKGSFNETLMNQHRNHVHIAMRRGGLLGKIGSNPVVRLLDRGGAWPSGSIGVNASGHTEQVLTGGPNGDMAALLSVLLDILGVLRSHPGEIADALERPTRRAVQLGRGRTVRTA